MSFVSEDYLAASIAKVSKYMNLSEAIAGATLLAFANGLPDVLTVMLASHKSNNDLGVGVLFGANIFMATIILGVVVLSTNNKIVTEVVSCHQLQTTTVPIELFLIVVGILLFITMAYFELRSHIFCLVLLLLYVFYISIVIWKDIQYTKSKQQKALAHDSKVKVAENIVFDEDEFVNHHDDNQTAKKRASMQRLLDVQMVIIPSKEKHSVLASHQHHEMIKENGQNGHFETGEAGHEMRSITSKPLDENIDAKEKLQIAEGNVFHKLMVKIRLQTQREFRELSWISKGIYILEFPVRIVM